MKLPELLRRVRRLEFPPGDYVIFGSAPLLLGGIIPEVQDIDIIALRAAWQKALEFAPAQKGRFGDRVVKVDQVVEVYDGWMQLDAQAVLASATSYQGLPFAALRDVAAYKRALARPKDSEHLRLMEPYLRAIDKPR